MKVDTVKSLPGLGRVSTTQFAGYASMDPPTTDPASSEKLFYWFVGGAGYDKRPTILWTNGGPGSSSFWGFFLENGPYTIETAMGDSPVVRPNPTGWNNYANYLIFEHPLSVTLSFASDDTHVPHTPQQGADQLYTALLNFVGRHPEIAGNPLILAGESYAGTYLPLLAQAILNGNDAGKTKLELRSTVLCDAWVDPLVQMSKNTEYAHTHGLISKAQKEQLDREYAGDKLPQLNDAIAKICGCYMANTGRAGDPAFDPVLSYLNRADVRTALHVASETPLVDSSSPQVSANYSPHVNESFRPVVQGLLDRGHRVQVVSGLNDAKDCNFLGTEAWLQLLTGPAADSFGAAEQEQWRNASNAVVGFYQDGGTLSWLKVLNAGHLAVDDQPLIIDKIMEKALQAGCTRPM